MGLQWYLVRTKPLCEYKASTALGRNGYELFFPLVSTPRPRLGRQDAPLFPGYLFVRQDRDSSRLTPLDRIEGMIGWVQFDGVAPEVPDEVIRELAKRLEIIDSQGGSWKRFQPGERVRVASGWVDVLAEVLEEPASPNSRVRVLLDFMGRLVRARVPWQDLQPVDEESVRPPRRTPRQGPLDRWIRAPSRSPRLEP